MSPIAAIQAMNCVRKMNTITMELFDQREKVIQLCNRYAQPGVNTDTHRLAYEILKILGEREDGK